MRVVAMEKKHNHKEGLRMHSARDFGATLLRAPLFHLFIIALIGMLVYANTLHSPLVFDSTTYINHENMRIPLADFLDAASLIRGSILDDPFKTAQLTRRFTILTFMLNYKLHGLSVIGYHLANIFIHLVTALLVYAMIARLWYTPFIDHCFQRAEEERERLSRWTAFLGAALFVAHPVNTQAVTYIAQRFASLATLLYLLALLAYLHSALRRELMISVILYGIALIAAVLAMFTKEISFTLPIVMFLCDRLFLKRPLRQTILAITPFLLTMAIIPWNLYQAKSLLASSTEGLSGSMNTLAGVDSLSRHDYFLTELRVIVTYFRLILFPVHQNLDYDYPMYTSLFTPPVFASFLLLLSIATVGFVMLRSSAARSGRLAGLYRLSAFGIFWFFMTMSVESSIQPIENVIYEHRLYLPFFGFILATVCTGAILWSRVMETSSAKARLVPVAGLLTVAVLGSAATVRNAVWQNETTLWEDVARKSPNKARVHNMLGWSYLEDGRIDEAQQQLIDSIRIEPRAFHPYLGLGAIAQKKHQYAEAARYYEKAIEMKPSNTIGYSLLGDMYLKLGKTDEAYTSYLMVISKNSRDFEAYYNLGLLCLERQRYDEALQYFGKALRLDPSNIKARSYLEWISEKLRNSN